MADIAITAQGVGKRYRLRHEQGTSYRSLREDLTLGARRMLGLAPAGAADAPSVEDFWALRDVGFELQRGEVLGIIGRNGAGKSTLLKILSRITEPSEGSVRIRGRVASLLEVGTGFHPELTGRENIYLNGAILGMTRAEIRRRFDEIVAFAGVERFLDTPVKRFSSGMYVRLAFAVAAHLDPEILIVDEVLAVGDAEFQKRCLGRMKDVSVGQGRSSLFVSHNLAAVRSICSQCIVLDAGRIVFRGPVGEAVETYTRITSEAGRSRPVRSGVPAIVGVEVNEPLAAAGDLEVRVAFDSPRVLDPLVVGVVVYDHLGSAVFGFNTAQDPALREPRAKAGTATLRIANAPLHSGNYWISVFLGDNNENYDVIDSALMFAFVAPASLPLGVDADFIGHTRVDGRWTLA